MLKLDPSDYLSINPVIYPEWRHGIVYFSSNPILILICMDLFGEKHYTEYPMTILRSSECNAVKTA